MWPLVKAASEPGRGSEQKTIGPQAGGLGKAAAESEVNCLVSLPCSRHSINRRSIASLPPGPLDSPEFQVTRPELSSWRLQRWIRQALCLQEAEHQVNTTAGVTLMELLLKHPRALCVSVIIVLEQEMARIFQYSCFEHSKDRGACGATVHGISKSWQAWVTEHAPYKYEFVSQWLLLRARPGIFKSFMWINLTSTTISIFLKIVSLILTRARQAKAKRC